MSEQSLTDMLQCFATQRPTKIDQVLEIMQHNCKVSPPKGIMSIKSLPEISTVPKILENYDALVVKSFFSLEKIEKILNRIEAHQSLLTQYSEHYKVLGRVWSSDFIMGNEEIYWKEAQATRETFKMVLPGIEESLLSLCKEHIFKDENVMIREGFCGPAVVIFSPKGSATSYGGDIHIDWEALEVEHIKNEIPCYSFVCMLALPEQGGETGVWNVDYVYENRDESMLEAKKTIVPYEIGDFAMFSSLKLHNIEPIAGMKDRVTLIFHVAYIDGYWQLWF